MGFNACIEGYKFEELEAENCVIEKMFNDDSFRIGVNSIRGKCGCEICYLLDNSDSGKIFIYGKEEKLESARNGINGIIENVRNIIETTSIIPYTGSMDYIHRYIEIGRKLSKSEQNESMKHLIDSVYSDKNPYEGMRNVSFSPYEFNYSDNQMYPYLFICASSGTGKTQLPFSLDIPMLYFLHDSYFSKISRGESDRSSTTDGTNLNTSEEDTNKSQPIYTYFEHLSRHLESCINEDLQQYREKYKNDRKKLFKNLSKYITEVYDTVKFSTIGFLVMMCEEIMKIHKNNGKEHWIISELKVKGMRDKKMTIKEGQDRINALFGDSRKPIVFLDESSMGPDGGQI